MHLFEDDGVLVEFELERGGFVAGFNPAGDGFQGMEWPRLEVTHPGCPTNGRYKQAHYDVSAELLEERTDRPNEVGENRAFIEAEYSLGTNERHGTISFMAPIAGDRAAIYLMIAPDEFDDWVQRAEQASVLRLELLHRSEFADPDNALEPDLDAAREAFEDLVAYHNEEYDLEYDPSETYF